MSLSLGGRGNLSLTARLVLGSGLALAACGVALLYSILRGEIADQHSALSEQLKEEMQFALPAMSGIGYAEIVAQTCETYAEAPAGVGACGGVRLE